VVVLLAKSEGGGLKIAEGVKSKGEKRKLYVPLKKA
jgi:hypothetical protein